MYEKDISNYVASQQLSIEKMYICVQLPTATRTAETVVNIVAPTVVAELPPNAHSRAYDDYPTLKASAPVDTQSL